MKQVIQVNSDNLNGLKSKQFITSTFSLERFASHYGKKGGSIYIYIYIWRVCVCVYVVNIYKVICIVCIYVYVCMYVV